MKLEQSHDFVQFFKLDKCTFLRMKAQNSTMSLGRGGVLYPPPLHSSLFDEDPGIMSEAETSSTRYLFIFNDIILYFYEYIIIELLIF